ncbi:MAG: class I SAM-dependent methyltransferase [Anaerolineae bacterium]|nr:class I SAM-dependent methyltransferase [Anaerolineae bacterium]
MMRLLRRLIRPSTPPTLKSTSAYALWAATYPPHAHNALMEIEQAAMLRLMPELRGRDVLDLACGTGRYGLIAAERGARRVVGVDNSLPMLKAGQLQGAAEAMSARLPFAAETFDVVLCGLALGHLPRAELVSTLAEISRVLRPGGVLLFSDFHPYVYLNGGRRTFTSPDGKTYAVEHYVYFPSEYFTLLRDSTMILNGFEEPRTMLGGIELPAVLVMRGEKPLTVRGAGQHEQQL